MSSTGQRHFLRDADWWPEDNDVDEAGRMWLFINQIKEESWKNHASPALLGH